MQVTAQLLKYGWELHFRLPFIQWPFHSCVQKFHNYVLNLKKLKWNRIDEDFYNYYTMNKTKET